MYKHALEYKWTVEQLKKVIALLNNPEFDSREVDPDLHERMEKAVYDGRIKCFNMRGGLLTGIRISTCGLAKWRMLCVS